MGESHVLVISFGQISKQLSNLNEIKLETGICKLVAEGLFERQSSIKV